MPSLLLASLAYVGVALPGSTLGLLWPSIRISFDEPIGALGALLAVGVAASVVASAATGHILARVRVGPLLAAGTMLVAVALAEEALAPSLWAFALGIVLFGLGFGAVDAALNAHAAGHFGARQINWMHASYGLGATLGPLLVTAMLSGGLGWRWTFAAMAAVIAVLGLVFTRARRAWEAPPRPAAPIPRQRRRAVPVLGALAFSAVETGIESGAGIWGYVFLTAGRGLPDALAGVAVSAYWATMFLGRAVLGPIAERLGPTRVLAAAVGGVAFGAALMAAPASGWLAVVGMMTLGLAAAPIFPLFTLTTAQRSDTRDAHRTTRTVSLQVAASAIGSALIPAAIGITIDAFDARALAPALLVLGLAMCGVYAFLLHPPRRSAT